MAKTVEQLKSLRKEAKAKKSTYNNRLNAIMDAYNNVYVMDGYCQGMQNKVNDCTGHLSEAIKGIKGISSICDNINDYKEKNVLSEQAPYNSAIEYIKSEIARCNSEKTNIDTKIKKYEKDIHDQGGVIMFWE
jgi:predicted  nucleic acid-binding Zn-ribbon protein